LIQALKRSSNVNLTFLLSRYTNVISTLHERCHAIIESTLNQSAKSRCFNVLMQTFRKR